MILIELFCGGVSSGENAPIFPKVTTLLVGGGSMSPPIMRAVENIFPTARIMTAYGETQTSRFDLIIFIKKKKSNVDCAGKGRL